MEVLALNADQTMSSKEIAELTGKLHKNVMRDINSLISEEAIGALSFQLSNYVSEQNKKLDMFELDSEAAQFLLNKYSHNANRLPSAGVYILECQGFYKIGIASDITKRVKALQCGSPFPLNVVVFCPVDKAKKVEVRLHKDYSHKHVHGEWFALSKKEVSRAIGIIKNQEGK